MTTEFHTASIIDVVVDDRSLTEARADVEDALSSVPLDVQAEVSGDGGEVAARDRARHRQLLTDQSESLEELREQLDENGTVAEWQVEHDLSRRRNHLLEEMLELQEDEDDRNRRPRIPGGGIGTAIGIGVGTVSLLGVGALANVLSSFSWPDLPGLPDWPDPPRPPAPPEPSWHPLRTEPVSEPLPVEEPGEATIKKPTSEYPVAEPSPAEYPVEEPVSDYPVEEPDELQVQKPSWVPLDVRSPEATGEDGGGSSNEGIIAALAGAGAVGGGAFLGREFLKRGGPTALRAGSSAGAGMLLTPEGLGITDHETMNSRRRTFNRHTPESMNMEMMEASEEHPGSVFSAEGRKAQTKGFRDMINAIKELREEIRSTQEDTSSARRTEVNVEGNVSVDGATRREVERGFEEAKREALREFDRQFRSVR